MSGIVKVKYWIILNIYLLDLFGWLWIAFIYRERASIILFTPIYFSSSSDNIFNTSCLVIYPIINIVF